MLACNCPNSAFPSLNHPCQVFLYPTVLSKLRWYCCIFYTLQYKYLAFPDDKAVLIVCEKHLAPIFQLNRPPVVVSLNVPSIFIII